VNLTEVKVEKRFLRYKKAISTSHGKIDERQVILVRVKNAEGNWGYGESSPLEGFSKETIEDVEEIIFEWSKSQNDDLLSQAPTAKSAIDCAVSDLKAQELGLPLHKFLNVESQTRLPVSQLILGETSREISLNARKATDVGYKTLKIKVGDKNLSNDLEKLKAVRETVGSEVAIRIDANGGWETNQAIEALGELDEIELEFVEEPTKGIDNLALIRKHVTQKIAIDESLLEIEDFETIATDQIADVVIIKPSAIGGISFASHVIKRMKNLNVEVVVTSLLDGAVGVAAAAHLASASELLNPAPGLATSSLLSDDLAEPLSLQNGQLILNDSPGLGVHP
tara:strand:- start:5557 stop:6573 length:1017 start_codon:yes stop_codon:yes gene_type:complete